jgi:glutathione-regulated potassium-efflux system ancillary protein KefC
MAQEHFPGLKLIVRARDMAHLITLRQLGVESAERETFESALALGRSALVQMGVGAYEARERADQFRRLNLRMLEEIVAQPEDDLKFRHDAYRRANALLTEMFNEDRQRPIDSWPEHHRNETEKSDG